MARLFERQDKLTITNILRLGKNAVLKVVGADGSESTVDLTEFTALDVTAGTGAASKALVLDASGDVDNGVGQIRQTGATLATEAGTGITAGTGTVYASSIQNVGGMFVTQILIDLTGLNSIDTDGDIIGVDGTANPCHIGQIVAADSGTILGGTMRCLEVPAGGDPNVFLGAADEGDAVENDAFSGLTNGVTVFDPNADWTVDMDRSITGVPGADQYLYLMQGDATGTDATYTAGKFLITLYGY